MASLSVTSNDIHNMVGDVSRAITYYLRRVMNFKRFLDRFTAQNLVDQFGLTIGDANLIKSAANDFATIDTTFQANRAFLDQVSGLDDV